jgi:hypothetical protein
LKHLNDIYGGVANKLRPDLFKYANDVDGVVNLIDIANSNSLDEATKKAVLWLIGQGVERIGLGEVSLVYNSLNEYYNETLAGTANQARNFAWQMDDIRAIPDWHKSKRLTEQYLTAHGLFEKYKNQFLNLYKEQDGYLPSYVYKDDGYDFFAK